MQWVLQEYEDTHKLGEVLERMGLDVSFHKVVPFVGELMPAPIFADKNQVIMFGSYSMRHYARTHGLTPGVFELRPFFNEIAWHPFLLNGPHNSRVTTVRELANLPLDGTLYFIRPVDDSKEIAGTVMDVNELEYLARTVNSLNPDEYIRGSMTPDTEVMLSEPVNIQREWRLWVVNDRVVTFSLYKMGTKVIYKDEIDQDVLDFATKVIAANPNYSRAYVLDICRSHEQLFILETNCMNAAGFYAADLQKLVEALEIL